MRCISPLYIRAQKQSVPCGKCNFCLSNKRADWSFRLGQELKKATSGFFVTFTYDDDHAIYDVESRDLSLEKLHMQLFIKRLRRYEQKKYGTCASIKYYTVGEYGTETERPHYHSILFNMRLSTARQLPILWGHGHVYVGTAEPASIHYTTKYCITRHGEYGTRTKPFALISKGLGKSYLVNSRKHIKGEITHIRTGEGVFRMPRYLKDKLWPRYKYIYDVHTREEKRITINVAVRERISKKLMKEVEELERLQLNRLRKTQRNPEEYIYQERAYLHEQLGKHLSKTSKTNL